MTIKNQFYILFFLLSVLCRSNIYAQNEVSNKQIDSINNLSFDFKIKNTASSIKLYTANLEIAKKNNYSLGIADAYSNLGLVYYYKGNYDLNTNFTLKSIRLYNQLNQKSKLAKAYSEYGYQLKKRNMKQANFYMTKGLRISESLNDEKQLSATYDNYGVLKEMENQLDSAYFYYSKALQLKEKNNDYYGIPFSLNNIGLLKILQKKPLQAKPFLDKAYQLRLKIKDNVGIAENLNLYGKYYKSIQDTNQAILYFKKALAQSKAFEYDDLTQDNYQFLADLYEQNKDYFNALKNYKLQVICKDSINSVAIRTKQAALDVEFETEQKEKQILIQQTKIAEKNLWILSGFSLLVISVLVGFQFYNRQKLKTVQLEKEKVLRDALLKIETQSKLQAQRLQISRDLHDNIGAQLTFIISSIDNLKYAFDIQNPKLDSKLESISDFTKDTIVELRDTIWAMNNSEITFDELRSRILNFIEKAKAVKENIVFKFDVDASLTHYKFTSVTAMNIYRIIQEAVNNSIKYANASQISVNAISAENQLNITVLDNGKGFDVDQAILGNGLNNIKKRADELGATIKITSEIEKGTQINLIIPMT
ncbi:MAG: tetratricopeptide repeat protein [Flavobacterium sp.]|nr:tetratricopeptide repeat protein [Flavobacterium sp.]